MAAEKYIVAVSGGIDSVVLLHKLVSVATTPGPHSPVYIVAHFDHGIRQNSSEDAAFVRRLAESYGLEYVSKRVELGPTADEASARSLRYRFLFECMKHFDAKAVITAHHRDDVLETMLVNLLRGTSPRGLIGFTQRNIVRPFLDKPKSWFLDYAQLHKLTWREDSTNLDPSYLRNYIRINLRPRLKEVDVERLLGLRAQLMEHYQELDELTRRLIVQITNKGELVRARFVVLPYAVQKELVAGMLRLENCAFDRPMIEKTTVAIKTLSSGKTLQIGQGMVMHTYEHTVAIVKSR